MIDQITIDRIIDNANIIEVVSEFVKLKKSGANFKGLCPFHNEKTPSFMVSPARGIFKCFGCGKGGNAVSFIMEHEHLSYYESLKYLARKFNIEIIEKEYTADEIRQKSETESLLVVTSFAQKFYSDYLLNHETGKTIGLSYFKERGFRDDIIQKFQLGYAPAGQGIFTKEALSKGYKMEYLVKTGLTIERENAFFDRFSDRVIFPIHNLMGRVIAFGGRILKSAPNAAKYINSPESEIYHKSKVLYGIFQAKRAIIQNDKCYLVEGYTDVISMHQAGIENVVASSGTSLTVDQIRLIKRFTNNITILYDGDMAGIKASVRGIDIVLEEGLNVRVLLLPQNEDPDSFSKKMNATELLRFISENETDFIRFKAQLFIDEAKDDPVKKAGFIREIISSIAVIPDSIARSVYIRECSKISGFDENLLYSELNKIRRKKYNELNQKPRHKTQAEQPSSLAQTNQQTQTNSPSKVETDVVRLLLLYGDRVAFMIQEDEHTNPRDLYVAEYIVNEFVNDELEFSFPLYQKIFNEFKAFIADNSIPDNRYFIHHSDTEISRLAVDLVSSNYELSIIWKKTDDFTTEEDKISNATQKAVNTFKHEKILAELKKLSDQIKKLPPDSDPQTITTFQERIVFLNEYKKKLSKTLGERVIQ